MATMTTQPPLFLGSVSGFGVHRVVVVAGVGRIDGDEGHVRRSSRPFSVGLLRRLASRSTASGKVVGNAVGMHGDEAVAR